MITRRGLLTTLLAAPLVKLLPKAKAVPVGAEAWANDWRQFGLSVPLGPTVSSKAVLEAFESGIRKQQARLDEAHYLALFGRKPE